MPSSPFIYATRSVIPSRYANAVQSANMVCAFSRLFDDFSAIFRCDGDYDLSKLFGRFALSPPRNVHIIRAHSWIDWSNLYLISYARFLRGKPKSTLVYTRSGRAAWVSNLLGFETIIELHDPLTPAYAKWLRSIIHTNHLVRLVATTARLKADLVEHTGIASDHVLVAGGGANKAFLDLPVRPCASKYDFNVGYAGSAFKGKGLEILIACAARLPQVGFHVIGPTPEECRPFGRFSPNVVFHRRKDNREAIEMLKGMDCLLLGSQRSIIIRSGADIGQHTSPLKMFEYMACGRAIIASDLPVLNTTLHHGKNALLAAPEDVDGFCAHILLLRRDANLRRRLGDEARCDFAASYSWDIRARAIQRFIYNQPTPPDYAHAFSPMAA